MEWILYIAIFTNTGMTTFKVKEAEPQISHIACKRQSLKPEIKQLFIDAQRATGRSGKFLCIGYPVTRA
jgi:hypothetical protein